MSTVASYVRRRAAESAALALHCCCRSDSEAFRRRFLSPPTLPTPTGPAAAAARPVKGAARPLPLSIVTAVPQQLGPRSPRARRRCAPQGGCWTGLGGGFWTRYWSEISSGNECGYNGSASEHRLFPDVVRKNLHGAPEACEPGGVASPTTVPPAGLLSLQARRRPATYTNAGSERRVFARLLSQRFPIGLPGLPNWSGPPAPSLRLLKGLSDL